MLVKAFSLLDTKSGLFSLPWFFPHDANAVRAVRALGLDKATTVGQYPSDYVLYCIGEFDDSVGLLTSPFAPRPLGAVSSLLVVE